jgi:hypothetical protein
VRAAAESLRYAILTGTGFYVVAALLLALSARRLHKDWNYPSMSADIPTQ